MLSKGENTMSKAPSGLYLGFDYGEKYIGVATGQSQIQTTSPLDIIRNNSGTPDWLRLEKLVKEWMPVGFVIGIPLHMDGASQAITWQARGFKKRLSHHFEIPSYEMDERLSTRLAAEIIKENRQTANRKKTSKADLDKIAASIILRNWFESIDEFN